MTEPRVWSYAELKDVRPDPEWIDATVGRVRQLLVGHPPQHQGMVLAELVVKWICGHTPACRSDVMEAWSDLVNGLVSAEELEE